MRIARPLAVLAVGALAVAACGSPGAGQPANVRVCQHYRTQRATVKNLAEPALADALQFETWVALDAEQATPATAVARDLAAMTAAMKNGSSDYDASGRVLADCTALGVVFQS